jgi:hypothetical protein
MVLIFSFLGFVASRLPFCSPCRYFTIRGLVGAANDWDQARQRFSSRFPCLMGVDIAD